MLPQPSDRTARRLPPGQQLIRGSKWPVVGESRPSDGDDVWTLEVVGCVQRPLQLSLAQVARLGTERQTIDLHCVTRWSRRDMQFEGVPLSRLLELAGIAADARFVSFVARSARRHSTSVTLADALRWQPLLALKFEDQPLPAVHGGPLRVVFPGKYFYKSLKWLERIELLAEDRLGYWEATAGYHNHADPWREERYLAADWSKQEVARLLAGLDIREGDLRGLSAGNRTLAGLQAHGARLRDADFCQADLRDADFSRANLSNARFVRANLSRANFRDADLDGADFRGADLRGADLRAASLFGTTWARVGDEGIVSELPTVDAATRWDPASWDELLDEQRQALEALLAGLRPA